MSLAPAFDPHLDEPEAPLYTARKQIYPQAVKGFYRRIKWLILAVTLGIYYLLPFVRWDRGPNAPSQAVLVDLPHRRAYFFFIEIWPQEVYYLTGLLILAALVLFLMNAMAGRIWCGYLCPQTVWIDLFMAVERLIEGDRRERMHRDAQPVDLEIFSLKLLKHSIWLLIAWWTGGVWVLYFADAPTLVYELATFRGEPIAYISILVLTFTTYTFAGLMREQVCLYMCPWPRIQAALTDEHALNVTYRYDRGEPRMSLKKATHARSVNEPAGDCIDCQQCVAVCPTGVDIRQGPNLGCIQCGLCIDACDDVMAKIDRPLRLIAYDTDVNIKRRQSGLSEVFKPVRARTLLYAVMIAAIGGVMAYALANRAPFTVNVIHDRNPIFVKLSDGHIRNGYTVRIANMLSDPQSFTLRVDGLHEAHIEIIGGEAEIEGLPSITVGADQTREMRVLVRAGEEDDREGEPAGLEFQIQDIHDGRTAIAHDFFRTPHSIH
ncbi:MAG: cytochrome c oxidase accessory protein CcoG [Beijerinckiaceae bacterium]|nr:cytochrome c oxidase accessory protein CcoG [Beijerinckiaceae bacterium]